MTPLVDGLMSNYYMTVKLSRFLDKFSFNKTSDVIITNVSRKTMVKMMQKTTKFLMSGRLKM